MTDFKLKLLIPTVAMLLSVNWSYSQNYSKRKILRDLEGLPGFEQAYVGFKLYDPLKDKVIAAHLEDKFMTPASNTKLFTFYTGLQMLEDRVPVMKYIVSGDSLIFWGTGNPLLFHPEVSDNTVIEFLKRREEKLFYWSRPTIEERFGPGWGWDDFQGYYSAEKSVFPIYGNSTISFIDRSEKTINIVPKRLAASFRERIKTDSSLNNSIRRSESLNEYEFEFGLPDSLQEASDIDTLIRPFRYSDDLFRQLLSDTLKQAVRPYEDIPDFNNSNLVYGAPIDTLYKHMLQPSDNLLAEQILMMASDQISDTLSTSKAIEYAKEHYFNDWTDELVWVDGSGLSRYNMFTPRSIIELLKSLKEEVGYDRLFHLLPAGGVSGTIKDWYAGDPEPHVFAKTGTVRNNHSLSGFIKTRKGKVLIFTFMVNHYTKSTDEVRKSMQIMLEKIHKAY